MKFQEGFRNEILDEVESHIGLDWYDLLTRTPHPPPMPTNSFMAYWTTRDGKHLSLWNSPDVIVTLFNKRVVYFNDIQQISLQDSFRQATSEFNQMKLGQANRLCETCGIEFNPSNDLGRDFKYLDRSYFYLYLQRSTCSEKCSRTLKWHNLIRKGMLEDAEFDKSITWESVWERFGPNCYLCGREAIYDQEDLGLRQGSRAWKERWGDYKRGDQDREAVVEHVFPRSKGGTHTWDNVRIACARCNLLKGDSIPSTSE